MYNLEKKQIDETVIKEFDLALDEKSYSKIYSELSPLEKKIVTAIAKDKCSNAEIVEAVGIASNALMVYKKSLSKKGVIDISNRGISTFQLPRFKEFILFQELI